MSEHTDNKSANVSNAGENQNTMTTPESGEKKSVDELMAEINSLKEVLKKTEDEKFSFIRKLEKHEKVEAEKEKKYLEEQGKFKELYESSLQQIETIKKQAQEKEIIASLKSLIVELGGQSIDTIIKLVDKTSIVFNKEEIDNESVKKAILRVKESDPILFKPDLKHPDLKRVNENNSKSAFEQKLQNINSIHELRSIWDSVSK